jgi:hypothetical protein
VKQHGKYLLANTKRHERVVKTPQKESNMLRPFKSFPLAMLPEKTIKSAFSEFTCEQLRILARHNGVRRGRNKRDTIHNLTDPEALAAFIANGVTLTINGY